MFLGCPRMTGACVKISWGARHIQACAHQSGVTDGILTIIEIRPFSRVNLSPSQSSPCYFFIVSLERMDPTFRGKPK